MVYMQFSKSHYGSQWAITICRVSIESTLVVYYRELLGPSSKKFQKIHPKKQSFFISQETETLEKTSYIWGSNFARSKKKLKICPKSLKKYIFKIAISKNALQKHAPWKNIFSKFILSKLFFLKTLTSEL